MSDRPDLRIDAARLWASLQETAAVGALPGGGIARLTLSAEDRRIRDWFRHEVEALGLRVTVDEVGNMFALRGGLDPSLPPIAIGSHFDTQPTGGKFDGNLGVLAGLEILRTLTAAAHVTRAPLLLVNWTNEEGARFAPAMLGSGVHVGAYDKAFAYARIDPDGIRFEAALDAIDYRGVTPVGATPLGAMFELHIEQGPVLEKAGKTIGVVQGVQGMRWFEVGLTGTAAHTGSTPMRLRRDALLGAAWLIQQIAVIAAAHAPSAVGSVGFVVVTPNSHNVIPGHVALTVDLRDPSEVTLDAMERSLTQAVAAAADSFGLDVALSPIARTPSVTFNPACIAAVRAAAARNGLSTHDLISGAGHDAAHCASVAPTTMIFVPSRGGLSHNEGEFTSPADCAAGTQVLLDAVLCYDVDLQNARSSVCGSD